MSTPDDVTDLPPDDPPKDGTWVDPEDYLADPTDDELAEGRRLGESIDTDDDDAGGLP